MLESENHVGEQDDIRLRKCSQTIPRQLHFPQVRSIPALVRQLSARALRATAISSFASDFPRTSARCGEDPGTVGNLKERAREAQVKNL